MMVIMVMMLIMMPGRHVLMMVLVKMMTLKMRMKNNVVKIMIWLQGLQLHHDGEEDDLDGDSVNLHYPGD